MEQHPWGGHASQWAPQLLCSPLQPAALIGALACRDCPFSRPSNKQTKKPCYLQFLPGVSSKDWERPFSETSAFRSQSMQTLPSWSDSLYARATCSSETVAHCFTAHWLFNNHRVLKGVNSTFQCGFVCLRCKQSGKLMSLSSIYVPMALKWFGSHSFQWL